MSGRTLLQLYTTMDEFEALHERQDRTRSTSKTVTVDRQALIHILMDHARMLEALRKAGRVDVADPHRGRRPAPARRRERQRGEGGFPTGLEVRGEAPGRPSWRP
ncbi:hypothetical protein [Mesorhizobium sp. 113-3-3]|uniref:hypothetical protein n=1 Tax=Mesorhizobium sp. 113-3-3 TaxID=2744516 RepID=UPI0018EBFBFD|nr:hypothetical protein [Mesorhizobium sp. 113-3-3]